MPDRIAPPDADARTEVNGQRRVLVIDDEALIRKTVRLACEQEGYAVEEAETGTQALTALESFRPDIILLDLMLPDISGFDICRDIRRTGSKVPILILSAKTEEIDVVVGLEIGADDYIVKPFRPRELLARIAAHLRKARQEDERGDDGRMVFRDLVIDVNERRVFRAGTEVNLTHTEFDLLTLLAAQAGKALSREKILNAVWGYDHPIETRVIDVHIRNLRRKIEENPSQPLYILAVPGVGYRFTATRP
jgi:DNA-binding response OmpR family regulator